MKLPVVKTRAGQYTWLQVLSLVISGIAYVAGSMLVAVVMLTLATVFGILAAVQRVKQAQQLNPQLRRGQRRR